ncbi:MAG: 2-C-methyl-D-erythritol 2,4-cyclodiphosphate synthase [Clostridia bacterium]|nr:2-C-methyl-D-erythritol 2,4-cyclodiphosphate synthase [Clostridia bacterium]
MRIGFGYDVHGFEEGKPFILGGVEIPFEKGLLGHSDADVLTHAVIDALFGAAALGDIGKHFPDTDERYKGISSIILLNKCVDELKERGYRVINVDSTVVLQKPRLSEYVDGIRENLARSLGISASCVSVKAKTEEGLGFTGRGLGVKAYAVALLEER